VFVFILYTSVGLLSVYMFGSGVDSNVLDNVNEESNTSSYIIRFMFLIVLACHIPYIFYFGKEGLLIFVDECMKRSMSKELDLKIVENLTKSNNQDTSLNT